MLLVSWMTDMTILSTLKRWVWFFRTENLASNDVGTGGGKFISSTGKAVEIDFSYNKEIAFELPEDALPSGIEMDRDLQAITISHGMYGPCIYFGEYFMTNLQI